MQRRTKVSGCWYTIPKSAKIWRWTSGSQIRESILQNLVPFKGRTLFVRRRCRTQSQTLSHRLVQFHRRDPRHTAGRKSDKQLPVHARVSPKVKNSVETGLGYSTDVGPRGRLIWKKPWLNDSGHSLEAAGDISKLEQMLDLTYKLPLEENALSSSGCSAEDTSTKT